MPIEHASRPSSRRKHVVIVGGGASGALVAANLLRDRHPSLHVTLIEAHNRLARGLAYSTGNADHLLNVRASNMSAFPDRPDHFWQWVAAQRRKPDAAAALAACADPSCFVPRPIYGEYIASLIAPLRTAHDAGGSLSIVDGECVALEETDSGIAARLADGRALAADAAVLATGHETPPPCDAPYASPWMPPAEAGVDPDSPVLLLGTGLTMIDYVLTLLGAGHRGRIVALSRRGLLPQVHRSFEPLRLAEAEVPVGAGVVDLWRWIRICVRMHSARGGDWRAVIDGLRPYTQTLWLSLSTQDRQRFLVHARAWWDVHRHRMAPQIAERIAAATTSGQLTVMAAKVTAVAPDATGAAVRFRRRGARTEERMTVGKIVDCRSAVAVPPQTANAVLCDLLDAGRARLDPLSLGFDVTEDGALRTQAGNPSQRLYAVGPLTRAAFWEIVAIPDIRVQSARLAAHLRARLGIAEIAPAATEARA